MSGIFDFIIGIFSFEDAIASLVFYMALVLVPVATHFVGKSSPEAGMRIMRWVFGGIAGLIGVGGIIIIFIISGSSEDFELESGKVDGKAIEKLEIRGQQEGLTVLKDGQYWIPKTLNEKAKAEAIADTPDRYATIDGEFFEIQEMPEPNQVMAVYVKGGERYRIVNNEYWVGPIKEAMQMSMIIIYLCFGLMLGYGLSKLVEEPKRAIQPLIFVGLLALIIVLGYGMEGSVFEPLSEEFIQRKQEGGQVISDSDQSDAGGGIIATFTLIGLAALTWVGGEVYKLFK